MDWKIRLTEARNAKAMGKSAFAKAVGVSAPTVTEWENGEIKKIDGENLLKVCDVLDVTPYWLLRGDEAEGGQCAGPCGHYSAPGAANLCMD